uniref:Uncharacterized protein n=1 Tax=Tetradesmus obliquus TaxID=3088 RepID=A0A383VEL3_TETOB|eukprot:jgi/Sobl393_1/18739/SZX64947.1
MSDLRSQRFCWVEEYAGDDADPLRVYGVARSLEVCEADNEVCRLQEELPLLLKEMKAHLKYWQRQVDQQQQVERVLLYVASKVRDADAEGLLTAEVAAEYAGLLKQSMQNISGGISLPEAEQQQGRYQASAAQLLAWPGALGGALSVRYAADDACWDEVGSEDEVWVPSNGVEDAESVDTVEQVD